MSRCGLDLEPNVEAVKDVYALCDAAIDQETSDLEGYAQTGDLDCLRLHPDYTPVAFTIQPVPWLVFRRTLVEAKFNFQDAIRELFRVGVRAWKGWENGDGQFLPIFEARPGQLSRLTDASFRRVPDRVVLDIGTAVYNASNLDQRVTDWMKELGVSVERSPPKDEHLKNS